MACPPHHYEISSYFTNDVTGQEHMIWKCRDCPEWYDRPVIA